MKIYELRAYIGKDDLAYTAIFTNIEAARNDADRLRQLCKRAKETICGSITPLKAERDRFKPQLDLTEHFN